VQPERGREVEHTLDFLLRVARNLLVGTGERQKDSKAVPKVGGVHHCSFLDEHLDRNNGVLSHELTRTTSLDDGHKQGASKGSSVLPSLVRC
jgi:hypothetical protein